MGCRQHNGHTESTTTYTFSAVVERCSETGLLVGYVPGYPGAHSQGETLEEVIAMLLEGGELTLGSSSRTHDM